MINKILGHYQITTQLGAGGMGEVYRARDTKLGRDVAIKVLPRDFAADQERLNRFDQEARTLATLNHPGILVIHDSGVHDGSPFLVSELLEGRTLRDVINEGPLLPRRAAEYAVQIANALAAAHAKSVVHRDLKPENLFITQDDRVKILDFGLAKLRASVAQSNTPGSARPTILNATEPGMVLGTPGYMSPEQARGGEAEVRSDIFSLGAILYEMLCGQRAFDGESSVQVMNAILTAEPPDLFERVTNLPPALERVVRRCLEKRPEQRFQTAADLAFALGNSISTGGSMLGGQRAQLRPRLSVGRFLPWAIAAIALTVAGYGLISSRRSSPVTAVAPEGSVAPLRKMELSLAQFSYGLAIAPDGKKLVYVTTGGLYLRWLDRVAPPVLLVAQQLGQSLNSAIQAPFWSPQSSNVGFIQGSELRRISINGGSVRPIATMALSSNGSAGGAWLVDDRIIFTMGNTGLYEVSAGGGTPVVALAPGQDEQDFFSASVLPGGRGVLFIVHRRSGSPAWDTIAVWSPGASRKVLLQTPGIALGVPVYSPSGHIVFTRRDATKAIWAFPFSLEKMERTGEAFRVVDEGADPSVADDGTLVYSLASATRAAPRQLVWVNRSGKIDAAIGPALSGLTGPQLSANGQRIVAIAGAGLNTGDVWAIDVPDGNAVPVTRTPENESDPFWYPDGRRVLYAAVKGESAGGWTTRERLVDGFDDDKEVSAGWVRSFSRSGKYLFVRAQGSDVPEASPDMARFNVWAYADLSVGSDRKLRLLPKGLMPIDVALSPDDRWMAYSSSESGRIEVSLVSFPDFGNKRRVSHDGGMRMQWHPSGAELFFLAPDRKELWSAAIKHDAELQIAEPVKLCDLPESINLDPLDPSRTRFQVAPDGQRFLMVENVSKSKDGASDQQQTSNAMLVENWFEEFREKK